MPIELFTRHFLGIYFLMIGLLFAARCLGLAARTGHSHIHYGAPGSRPWWNRQLFNGFRAAILIVCVLRIGLPLDPWLGIFPALYQGGILAVGVACLLASFTGLLYLQGYLNADWRSGVDEEHRPTLLTAGPYRRSRNPVFLVVMLGQAGFFLALPSVFSLLCLVVGVSVLVRQARVEEGALERLYGEAYRRYRQSVPRWL